MAIVPLLVAINSNDHPLFKNLYKRENKTSAAGVVFKRTGLRLTLAHNQDLGAVGLVRGNTCLQR